MDELKIDFSKHNPKKCVGLIFENYGKCPNCGSKSKQDLGILGNAWREYRCLMCGTEWTEPIKELQ